MSQQAGPDHTLRYPCCINQPCNGQCIKHTHTCSLTKNLTSGRMPNITALQKEDIWKRQTLTCWWRPSSSLQMTHGCWKSCRRFAFSFTFFHSSSVSSWGGASTRPYLCAAKNMNHLHCWAKYIAVHKRCATFISYYNFGKCGSFLIFFHRERAEEDVIKSTTSLQICCHPTLENFV